MEKEAIKFLNPQEKLLQISFILITQQKEHTKQLVLRKKRHITIK